MGSQSSQPDPDPDETRDESTESGPTEDTSESQPGGLPVSRRAALASLVGLGALGMTSSTASAAKGKTWKKDRDADGNDLLNLGALTMADNPTEITDFTGANLGVANGKLSAAQWNKDVDAGGSDLTNLGSASASIVNADTLSDNGSGTINLGALVDADKNELKQLGAVAMQQNKTKIVDFAGDNLSIDSDNILNARGTPWEDTDDDGFLEAPGFDGIHVDEVQTPRFGTAIDAILEGVVNGERFLQVVPTATDQGPNVLAGHLSNTVSDVAGATIAGGGKDGQSNTVEANYATVGGGRGNAASDVNATVCGGLNNRAGTDDGDVTDAKSATVAGGVRNEASNEFAAIGGGRDNEATHPKSTVGGGGGNRAIDRWATVGGGLENTANGDVATIGGGTNNTTSGSVATVAGGVRNEATGAGTTIGGGADNQVVADYGTIAGGGSSDTTDSTTRENTRNAVFDEYGTIGGGGNNKVGTDNSDSTDAEFATVGGGRGNTANGTGATVPGGILNDAFGRHAFAAGVVASAANNNTFVWNDGTPYHPEGLSSSIDIAGSGVTGANTFHASAQGGFRFITGSNSVTYISSGSTGWATTSTRAAKTNIDPVDPRQVLAGVKEMEISTWEYKDEDGGGQGVRHIGPMAEDFHEAVDVGDSDDHINSINADGVAFAAIQGLTENHDEMNDRIDDLEAELAARDTRIGNQRDRIDRLESTVERKDGRIDNLEAENERLRERLSALEDRLTSLEAGQSSPAAADD